MNVTRAVRAPMRPRRFSVVMLAIPLGATFAAACGTTDDRPAAWEYISPAIFQPNCATSSCHSRAAAVAGLDFSDPERGYVSLTGLWIWIVDPKGTADQGCRPMNGTVVCQRPNRPMVTPFDPAQSRVVNMLRARDAPRMPPDRPVPEADIELVERWILNGANRTFNDPAAADAGQQEGGPPGDAAAARADDARDAIILTAGADGGLDDGTTVPDANPASNLTDANVVDGSATP